MSLAFLLNGVFIFNDTTSMNSLTIWFYYQSPLLSDGNSVLSSCLFIFFVGTPNTNGDVANSINATDATIACFSIETN